jgi:Mrp family chromosome partitioning ATPase
LRQAWPARFAADAPTLFDPQADAKPASAARPLSAFAPTVPMVEPVRPLLEVDRFEWPPQCQGLCVSSPVALDGFVSRLLSGAAEGLRRVALIGLGAAAGRTTVAMCLARRAAAKGENWVLVDADFQKPELAKRLGINAPAGWSRVLAGQQELGEVMIASLEDRFAIVPLEPGSAGPEPMQGNPHAAEVFDMLADAYGLVLFDAGSPGPVGVERLASFSRTAHWDSTYLVYDARTTRAGDVAAYARQLASAGLRVAGAIENFTPRLGDSGLEEL